LDAHGHLTSREQEVVELVRAGHNSRQIAERLVVSERTVESHRWNAYQKLGVHNARELHAIFDAETR
ncbi:MAG TPA: helix-turn-helix transcriptional regulator, partial [Actinomycetota bacterium]